MLTIRIFLQIQSLDLLHTKGKTEMFHNKENLIIFEQTKSNIYHVLNIILPSVVL